MANIHKAVRKDILRSGIGTECLGCNRIVWDTQESCAACGHPNDHFKVIKPKEPTSE